jgi:hypothetical protein
MRDVGSIIERSPGGFGTIVNAAPKRAHSIEVVMAKDGTIH